MGSFLTMTGSKSNHMHIWPCIFYDLLWNMVFYPTSQVFSIPEPWQGNRNHTTCWIKIIHHCKSWEILFITYLFYILLNPRYTCDKLPQYAYINVCITTTCCNAISWTAYNYNNARKMDTIFANQGFPVHFAPHYG